jgi:hypothetical protein
MRAVCRGYSAKSRLRFTEPETAESRMKTKAQLYTSHKMIKSQALQQILHKQRAKIARMWLCFLQEVLGDFGGNRDLSRAVRKSAGKE